MDAAHYGEPRFRYGLTENPNSGNAAWHGLFSTSGSYDGLLELGRLNSQINCRLEGEVVPEIKLGPDKMYKNQGFHMKNEAVTGTLSLRFNL